MPVRRKEGRSKFGANKTSQHGGGLKAGKVRVVDASTLRSSEQSQQNERIEATRLAHKIDEGQGFERFDAGKKRVGWLLNMHSTVIEDEKDPGGRAAVDFYFLGEDDVQFKASVEYQPYFLIGVKKGGGMRRLRSGLREGLKGW